MIETIMLALTALEEFGGAHRARQQGAIQSDYFQQALSGFNKAKSTLDKSLGQKMKLPTLEAK